MDGSWCCKTTRHQKTGPLSNNTNDTEQQTMETPTDNTQTHTHTHTHTQETETHFFLGVPQTRSQFCWCSPGRSGAAHVRIPPKERSWQLHPHTREGRKTRGDLAMRNGSNPTKHVPRKGSVRRFRGCRCIGMRVLRWGALLGAALALLCALCIALDVPSWGYAGVLRPLLGILVGWEGQLAFFFLLLLLLSRVFCCCLMLLSKVLFHFVVSCCFVSYCCYLMLLLLSDVAVA